VGQAEDAAAPADPGHQIERVGERGGERLVADDVEAGIQGRDADRMMAVVGRHHRQHLDAVLARLLGGEQFAPVAIGASRIDAEIPCRCAGSVGAGREHRGPDLEPVVEPGRRPVHRADE
jgi:hypothetical protein